MWGRQLMTFLGINPNDIAFFRFPVCPFIFLLEVLPFVIPFVFCPSLCVELHSYSFIPLPTSNRSHEIHLPPIFCYSGRSVNGHTRRQSYGEASNSNGLYGWRFHNGHRRWRNLNSRSAPIMSQAFLLINTSFQAGVYTYLTPYPSPLSTTRLLAAAHALTQMKGASPPSPTPSSLETS
jgi:hypothetical protein